MRRFTFLTIVLLFAALTVAAIFQTCAFLSDDEKPPPPSSLGLARGPETGKMGP